MSIDYGDGVALRIHTERLTQIEPFRDWVGHTVVYTPPGTSTGTEMGVIVEVTDRWVLVEYAGARSPTATHPLNLRIVGRQ